MAHDGEDASKKFTGGLHIPKHRKVTQYLMYIGSILFSLIVLLVAAFMVWNVGAFLYRLSEAIWNAVFRDPWI